MKPVVGATVKQPWCEARVVLIVVRGHVVKTCGARTGRSDRFSLMFVGLRATMVVCLDKFVGSLHMCCMMHVLSTWVKL